MGAGRTVTAVTQDPSSPADHPDGTAHPYLLLVLACLFWAGNVIAGRSMAETAPPITLAFCRWSLALLLVLPFGLPHLRAATRRLAPHWKLVLLLGLLGVTGFNTLLYAGLNFTTAINATVVGATTPAVILQGDIGRVGGLAFNRGDLLVLGSVVVWAAYSVLLMFLPAGVHPLALLPILFSVGWLGLLPFVAWEWSQGLRMPITAASAAAVAFTAVFPSILSFLFWIRAVARVGPTTAGFFMNLVPVFTALLAVLMLGEALRLYHLAGLALVFAGIHLATRKKKKASRPRPAADSGSARAPPSPARRHGRRANTGPGGRRAG